MSWQALATLWAAVVGACLGVVYDGIRLTRAAVGISYSRRFEARLAAVRLPFLGVLPTEKRPPRRRKALLLSLYVAVGDVLFFLVAAFALTVFLYHANNGIPRWYLLAGMAIGFLFYYFTVSRLTTLISEPFRFACRALAAYGDYFLLRPLRLLAGVLLAAVRRVFSYLAKRRRIAFMKKYTKNIENTLDKFSTFV